VVNIAVTGGLGSGKSTVSKILARTIGAGHLDTDLLCRQQMQPGQRGFEKFREVFGNRYLHADGSLDRTSLRQAVFTDSRIKNELEMILHPLVRQEVAAQYAENCRAGENLVVEVPLLFESGWQYDFAVWVVVYVAEESCLLRVAARDGLSSEEIRRVIAAQMPLADKLAAAHFVVDNSGTYVSTVQQIAWLGKNLKVKDNERNYAASLLKTLTAQG
jgi:dephospho-CoA kinase